MATERSARPAPAGFHGAFRQSMSWLHTWVGLVLGVVLYFIFVTGTVGYAHHEITRWMQPELGRQAAAPVHGPAEMAEAGLAAARANLPGAPLIYLTLPTGGRAGAGVVEVYAEPPEAVDGGAGEAAPEAYEARLDPATLAPRGAAAARETAGGETLYAMHYNLHYIPFASLTLWGVALPAWPTLIVGVATMFMLVAIVTGVVVHKKILADLFVFRPGKGQRSWLDAHNLSSVLALPFMVMITYSGLVMYSYDYMPTAKTLAYGIDPDTRVVDCELHDYGCTRREPTGEAAPLAPLAPMIAEAQARWPDDAIKWVDVYNLGDRAATVDVWPASDGNWGHYPSMSFDGVTGEAIARPAPAAADPVGRTGEVLLALHEGLFAGPVLRWLYLASGVVGAAMVATGLILWTAKRRRKLRQGQRADPGLVLVERANVAIVLGLPIAVAAYLWANRLLPVGMEGRADWEVHAMFAVWGLTFAHAALRPAPRAWVEQLALAALAFALLPALNALTTDIHLGRTLLVPAPERDLALASVDLALLGLGAAFGLGWRRARAGGRVEGRVGAGARAGAEPPQLRRAVVEPAE